MEWIDFLLGAVLGALIAAVLFVAWSWNAMGIYDE